ncbi:MAG: ankyrin repeat domain-containing protein [Lapillicoccus sp.]
MTDHRPGAPGPTSAGGQPAGASYTDAQIAFLNAVFDSARAGDTATVSAHVDRGVPVDLTNANGDTLLILAAYHEHVDLVRALLDRGADTTRVNDRAQTALVAAVFRSAGPIVAHLLAAGADPELGSPNAHAVADYFHLPEMTELLEREV